MFPNKSEISVVIVLAQVRSLMAISTKIETIKCLTCILYHENMTCMLSAIYV